MRTPKGINENYILAVLINYKRIIILKLNLELETFILQLK